MAPDASGSRIVGTWTELSAPTGEGTHYQTEDGRVWREVVIENPLGTGDRRGDLVGGRVVPR